MKKGKRNRRVKNDDVTRKKRREKMQERNKKSERRWFTFFVPHAPIHPPDQIRSLPECIVRWGPWEEKTKTHPLLSSRCFSLFHHLNPPHDHFTWVAPEEFRSQSSDWCSYEWMMTLFVLWSTQLYSVVLKREKFPRFIPFYEQKIISWSWNHNMKTVQGEKRDDTRVKKRKKTKQLLSFLFLSLCLSYMQIVIVSRLQLTIAKI